MQSLLHSIASLSLPVLLHLIAAVAAVLLGAAQMLASRGGQRHRWVGYAWVAAMATTAVSSFWIKGPLGRDWLNGFSFIHGLSVWTLISLVVAVEFARRGKVASHRRWMQATFASLIAAGVFAAASPGRAVNALLLSLAAQ